MDVDINGIKVIFPYKPYDIQVDYMRSVITALQKKQNALLESPTGTGKTLSLLCSTLAWLEDRKFQDLDQTIVTPKETPSMKEESQGKGKGKGWKSESPIRIIYSSRTHTQLNQACRELKNCYYRFNPAITIGSRDQLCINPEVTNLESISAKNQACQHKVKNNLCNFHHNYERKVSDLSMSGAKVYDIEDLISFGNEHKACPYYMAKAKSDFNTSLIFMPYNYVLDPSIRRTMKFNVENSVIIFDEGHNIERVCEDSMSTELKSETLALFIRTFDSALQSLHQLEEGKYEGTNGKELSELKIHDVARIKLIVCDFEVELERLVKRGNKANEYHPTEEIFHLMERVGMDYQICSLICTVCEKMISFVMNSTTSFMTNSVIASLTAVCSFIEIVVPFSYVKSCDFTNYKKEFVKNYRFYSENEAESFPKNSWAKKKSSEKESTWTIYLWCMSPSVAIQSLLNLGVYNLIITSGTLAPLESFEAEMGIPFQVKLQNTHVISRNQLSIQFIFKDPNGNELSGSFENRNNPSYYNGLGYSILELARTVPKGMFIFFSSYSLINRCIEMWKAKQGINIWSSISSQKRIFVEPRNKNDFNDAIQSFKEVITNTQDGAIFMGVSRGKLSEGIDLADDYCRAVVIVGLPYPARYDPKVVLKQKYLDENSTKLTGIKWYMLQMKRALNQSIGRVVRHRKDYGTIIICDSRIKQLQDGLSKWIADFLDRNTTTNTDFRSKIADIQQFFRQVKGIENDPVPIASCSNSSITLKGDNRSKTTGCQSAANYNPNDKLVENFFDSMKNNYKSSDNVTSSFSKPKSDSIFDSFDSSFGQSRSKFSTPKRNLDSSSRLSEHDSEKKSKVFRSIQVDYSEMDAKSGNNGTWKNDSKNAFKINDKFRSKYFTNIKSKMEEEPISRIEVVDLVSDEDESKETAQETNEFDTQEMKHLKSLLFITAKDLNTFERIVHEIKTLPFKCRQFVETLKVFSTKRNSTYLALRMNFILDCVSLTTRDLILKDLSLIVPERERKHFLRTCKVDC